MITWIRIMITWMMKKRLGVGRISKKSASGLWLVLIHARLRISYHLSSAAGKWQWNSLIMPSSYHQNNISSHNHDMPQKLTIGELNRTGRPFQNWRISDDVDYNLDDEDEDEEEDRVGRISKKSTSGLWLVLIHAGPQASNHLSFVADKYRWNYKYKKKHK